MVPNFTINVNTITVDKHRITRYSIEIMKVFFAASQRGKRYFVEEYKAIYELLSQLGYSHLDQTLIKTKSDEFYDGLDKGGRDAYVNFYNRNVKYLQEADINIFECSLHSLSIGFMVQKSLEYVKPTIVLYLEGKTPYFLAGNKEENLIVKSYNANNLKKVLSEALEEAKEKTDKRFNFFINPSLLAYLNKVAREKGITKSTFIRNLILEHKQKEDAEATL